MIRAWSTGMFLGSAVVTGVALTALYTLLISGADALTKQFATHYAAPQLFALSWLLVALFCVLTKWAQTGAEAGNPIKAMRTRCPVAMAIRVTATILGTLAFFYAFRLLPFADVFLFIAMIPLMAALMSGPILKDRVAWQAWAAVCLGIVGIACLFPGGLSAVSHGHLVAFAAAALGTVSMVASRYIGLRDDNLLAQVFYPNLSLGLISALALPFVFQPMSLGHLSWAVAYALLLFGARWVLVAALRLLPAFVVTPLMNLQFLWMVGIAILFFGERPTTETYLGASVMIVAGAWLVWEQARPKPATEGVPVPAE